MATQLNPTLLYQLRKLISQQAVSANSQIDFIIPPGTYIISQSSIQFLLLAAGSAAIDPPLNSYYNYFCPSIRQIIINHDGEVVNIVNYPAINQMYAVLEQQNNFGGLIPLTITKSADNATITVGGQTQPYLQYDFKHFFTTFVSQAMGDHFTVNNTLSIQIQFDDIVIAKDTNATLSFANTNAILNLRQVQNVSIPQTIRKKFFQQVFDATSQTNQYNVNVRSTQQLFGIVNKNQRLSDANGYLQIPPFITHADSWMVKVFIQGVTQIDSSNKSESSLQYKSLFENPSFITTDQINVAIAKNQIVGQQQFQFSLQANGRQNTEALIFGYDDFSAATGQ